VRSTGPSTPANFRSDFASKVGRPPVQGPGFQTPLRPSPMTAPRTSPVAIPRASPLTNAPVEREGYGEYTQREEYHEAAYTSPRRFAAPQIHPPQHEYITQSHSPPQFQPSHRNQGAFITPRTTRSYPFIPANLPISPPAVESRHFTPARAATSAAVSARPPSSVIRRERGRLERGHPSHPYPRPEGERPGSSQFVAQLNAHGKTRR
jgi:hypothetical protein